MVSRVNSRHRTLMMRTADGAQPLELGKNGCLCFLILGHEGRGGSEFRRTWKQIARSVQQHR